MRSRRTRRRVATYLRMIGWTVFWIAAVASAALSMVSDVRPFTVLAVGVTALLFAEGVAWLINIGRLGLLARLR